MRHFDFLFPFNKKNFQSEVDSLSQEQKDLIYQMLRMLEIIINPSVLSVCFFNFNLMKTESDSVAKEKQYSFSTLPKISIINLDGFDNPVNFLLLREFNKTSQYISIYDDNNENLEK
jgi:hypothetical protein